ncbi:MAG: hypothetical protein QXO94_06295 [Candidatus Bathyarchaeia archaeon]
MGMPLGKWYIALSSEKRRDQSAKKVLGLVPKDREVPWSLLAKKAEEQGISKATLSKHLKRFVALNIVSRRVDDSTYPPTVYYKRNKEEETTFTLGPYPFARAIIDAITGGLKEDAKEEDVEKWIRGQTYLLLAEAIWALNILPPFFAQILPKEEYERRDLETFRMQSKRFLIWLDRLHSEFLKIALSEPPGQGQGEGEGEGGGQRLGLERLSRIAETLLFEYCSIQERALDCFGLSIEKVREMREKGEMPKIQLKVRAEELFSERMIEKLREQSEREEGKRKGKREGEGSIGKDLSELPME